MSLYTFFSEFQCPQDKQVNTSWRLHEFQHGWAKYHTPVEFDSEAQVSNTTAPIFLDEDVFALQVTMGNGRLSLGAINLCVQVAQAAGSRVSQLEQRSGVQGSTLQEVVEGTILVVVGDQVELSPGACTFNVRCYETCPVNQFSTLVVVRDGWEESGCVSGVPRVSD